MCRSCPQIPIQAAVLDGFKQVLGLDLLFVVEIG